MNNNKVRPRSRSGKLACSNRQAKLSGNVPILKTGTFNYLASLSQDVQENNLLTSLEKKEVKRKNRALRKALFKKSK